MFYLLFALTCVMYSHNLRFFSFFSFLLFFLLSVIFLLSLRFGVLNSRHTSSGPRTLRYFFLILFSFAFLSALLLRLIVYGTKYVDIRRTYPNIGVTGGEFFFIFLYLFIYLLFLIIFLYFTPLKVSFFFFFRFFFSFAFFYFVMLSFTYRASYRLSGQRSPLSYTKHLLFFL